MRYLASATTDVMLYSVDKEGNISEAQTMVRGRKVKANYGKGVKVEKQKYYPIEITRKQYFYAKEQSLVATSKEVVKEKSIWVRTPASIITDCETSLIGGHANKGEQFRITETATGSGYTWGKYSGGWICLDYTNYDLASKEESADANKVTANGVIVKTNKLNIRSQPSASSAKVGQYSKGDKVKSTLQQTVGGTTWGRIEQGWISLDYVILDGAASSAPQPAVQTKTVVADCLRVRSDAGTGHSIVGYLYNGAKVEIEAAKQILRAVGIEGQCGMDIVSCPTCGRTKIDLISLVAEFERRAKEEGITSMPIKVALMGCVVNGPGEAREADIGVAGGIGEGLIIKKGQILRKVPEEQLLEELRKELLAMTDR